MRIDKQMNLVLEFDREKEPKVYIHATPIEEETFASYHSIIAKTFTKIYAGGYGPVGGPPVAEMILRDIAEADQIWESKGGRIGVRDGLVAEIHRRAVVLRAGQNGAWEQMPYDDAKAAGIFSAREARVTEGALTFFTVLSLMHEPAQLIPMLEIAWSMLPARIESLNCMEFRNFLSTSTKAANTGEKKKEGSSAPSSSG